MVDRACQILIKDNAWRRVPNVRAMAERQLRKALEVDGCHDIELTDPEHRLIEPDEDHAYEPFWAWEIIATGMRDA
jgi:hypothetical protein